MAFYEAFDERGLANPRLAAEQHGPAMPGGHLAQAVCQLAQKLFAFEQLHLLLHQCRPTLIGVCAFNLGLPSEQEANDIIYRYR